MAWAWYAIKNVDETLLNDVPDETIDVVLEDVGTETVRFIRGIGLVGIIFRNYLLFPNMNGRNPFTKDDKVGAMIEGGQYYIGINEDA